MIHRIPFGGVYWLNLYLRPEGIFGVFPRSKLNRCCLNLYLSAHFIPKVVIFRTLVESKDFCREIKLQNPNSLQKFYPPKQQLPSNHLNPSLPPTQKTTEPPPAVPLEQATGRSPPRGRRTPR
uniref:(northern house mosquito) hypothetical protein n=1 Tax=Culex pipiens TaxID=7175 RepID=A0A8D8BHW3_CULPI